MTLRHYPLQHNKPPGNPFAPTSKPTDGERLRDSSAAPKPSIPSYRREPELRELDSQLPLFPTRFPTLLQQQAEEKEEEKQKAKINKRLMPRRPSLRKKLRRKPLLPVPHPRSTTTTSTRRPTVKATTTTRKTTPQHLIFLDEVAPRQLEENRQSDGLFERQTNYNPFQDMGR